MDKAWQFGGTLSFDSGPAACEMVPGMSSPAHWQLYVVSSVLGYLLGSVPTGYIVARRYGIDIREHGSGNIGATNVVRVLGKKPGYFVFACDLLKGFLSARLGMWLALWIWTTSHPSFVAVTSGLGPVDHEPNLSPVQVIEWASILGALCCILGHNFPVWLRFRGGKGVATTVGVLLGLMPAAFLVAAVVWTASFYAFRYVSLASLLAAAVLPPTVWLLTRHTDPAAAASAPCSGSPSWRRRSSSWRHRANIARLLNGTEARFAPKPKSVGTP